MHEISTTETQYKVLGCPHEGLAPSDFADPTLRGKLIPSKLGCLLLLCCLSATGAGAQQRPQLILEDSRGPMDGNTLVIGRDLRVGLAAALPEHQYRFVVFDEAGGEVAGVMATTDSAGSVEPVEVWDRSGVDGCRKKGKLQIDFPFANVADASDALDGRVFMLAIIEPTTQGVVLSTPIPLQEPSGAVYYWSDARGDAKCLFDSNDSVYLSVFKGDLETWQGESRVFMFNVPVNQDDWQNGMPFEEVRLQPNCQGGNDVCGYPEGTIEPLPQQSTVKIQGVTPQEGGFLAIIRPAEGGWEDTIRHDCDRVTESVMYVHSQPVDLNDSDDGWGCPPCPP